MSDVRQLRVSMDFVLLEHDWFGRPNLLVFGGYVLLVLWSCTVFRGMQYGYGTSSILHPFAGALSLFSRPFTNARGVRGFFGRE